MKKERITKHSKQDTFSILDMVSVLGEINMTSDTWYVAINLIKLFSMKNKQE